MSTSFKVSLAFLACVAVAALIFFLLPQYSGLTGVIGVLFFGYVLHLSQGYFQGKRRGDS